MFAGAGGSQYGSHLKADWSYGTTAHPRNCRKVAKSRKGVPASFRDPSPGCRVLYFPSPHSPAYRKDERGLCGRESISPNSGFYVFFLQTFNVCCSSWRASVWFLLGGNSNVRVRAELQFFLFETWPTGIFTLGARGLSRPATWLGRPMSAEGRLTSGEAARKPLG